MVSGKINAAGTRIRRSAFHRETTAAKKVTIGSGVVVTTRAIGRKL